MISARKSGGFTLIEMLVVLAILGVAIGVAVGAMPRRGGGLDMANATDSVSGALRLARARAIASGQPVIFSVAAGGAGYLIGREERKLPPSIRIAMAGPPAISFGPDGSASGGIVRVVGVTRTALIQVDWLTGRVAMQSGS